LKSGKFEIQNQANAKLGNPKIVHHLATFMVGNSINDLLVDNYDPGLGTLPDTLVVAQTECH